jgi:hypothetical protein
MAITITQEDGSGVATANSYITLAEYEAYLVDRGLTDSRDDEPKKAAIISAKDWIESKEDRFTGTKAARANALCWPRVNAYAHGYVIDSDEIPSELKSAQCQLAYDSANNSLFAVGSGREVIRKKIDVLETEYAETGNGNVQKVFAKAEAFLRALYKSGSSIFPGIRV